MNRSGLRTQLAQVGAAPVPPARVEFVDALAERVVQWGAPGVRPVSDPHPTRVQRARLAPRLAVAGVALVVAVAVVFVGLWSDDDPAQALELAFAVDTTVQLPDGQVVRGRAGLELPEGSVVRTGPDGRARVGDVRLGPNERAVVRDGVLRVRDAAPPVPSDEGGNANPSGAGGSDPAGGTPDDAPGGGPPVGEPGGGPVVTAPPDGDRRRPVDRERAVTTTTTTTITTTTTAPPRRLRPRRESR